MMFDLSLHYVWRPDLPDSVDGKPLITQASQLFTDFPYERLPTQPPVLLALLLRPEVVYCLVIAYLLSERPVRALRDWLGINPKSRSFTYAIALHNFALAIFSAVCAYNSWPIVLQHWHRHGWFDMYCDPSGQLWNKSGLGVWSTIFYVSKYYELLDTWILILKGKHASFLQKYHHAGIVLAMYGGVASQSSWLLFVVLLNSVIHTLMYAYFFLKTVAPHVEIKSARYLTMAQITQFYIGITSTLGVLWMGDQCDTSSSRFSLVFLHVYGLGLIALFVAFAQRKYKLKER